MLIWRRLSSLSVNCDVPGIGHPASEVQVLQDSVTCICASQIGSRMDGGHHPILPEKTRKQRVILPPEIDRNCFLDCAN